MGGKLFVVQSRLAYMPREGAVMDETHDENGDGNPPVTRQDLHDLIAAINASRTQMDGQLKALKEEMLRGQEEVTEKAVKRARREREYRFKRRGNCEQFTFNEAIANKMESAKEQLISAQRGVTSTAATEKAVKASEEGLALIEERQKLIKLANHSDTGWLMFAEYQEDELAEDIDDEKRIEKAERSAERKLLKKRKGASKGKA